MPVVSPTGQFSEPLRLARESLAACATFRTLTSAASVAVARTKIHYFGIDAPLPWAALTAFAVREVCAPDPALAFVYECTTAGTSAATEPTWPTTAGSAVYDGTCAWTARARIGDAYNSAVRLLRPYALVGVGEQYAMTVDGVGTANDFSHAGDVALLLEADVPAAYARTFAAAGLWWSNALGAILAELRATAGTEHYLNIMSVALKAFHHQPLDGDPDEGAFCQAIFSLGWQ